MQADFTIAEKEIRYNRETRDYDCTLVFADGSRNYLGSRATYGDGETLCNAEYYKLLDATQSEAEVNQEAPAAIPDDVVKVNEREFADDGSRCTDYTSGDVRVTLYADEAVALVVDGDAIEPPTYAAGVVALRALSFILEHPDIRRLIGRDVPQTPAAPVAVTVEDKSDEDGEWVTYRAADGTSIDIESRSVFLNVATELPRADGIAQLHTLASLLSHPNIQHVIGCSVPEAPQMPVTVERWTPPTHESNGVTFKAGDVEIDLTEVGQFAGHLGIAFVHGYIEGDEALQALEQAPSLVSLAARITHARARVLAGLPAVRVAA